MIRYIDGLKIYYEVIGSGKPILILHGWANDSGIMHPIAQLVKRIGFTAYTIDLPGFGLSDFPPQAWDVNNYALIVEKFIKELGLESVDIIAHSFGGRVSIKLASNKPEMVNKLVLVDSAGIKPTRSINYFFKVSVTKVLRRVVKILPFALQESIDSRLLSKLGSKDYRNAGRLRETFTKIINEDLRGLLPNIKSRVLLIWGENDQETPLSDGKLMSDLIPNSQLEIIQGGGHHSFLDDFKSFSYIITPFLTGAPIEQNK